MPLDKKIKKVLLIGSGPIVIGQAAEFDYAGAQACRVLKAEGVKVVLVNSNPATIMTDNALADKIYLEPLTLRTIKRIIEKEKPDSLLASLGGQTGLTLAMQLNREGFLKAHNIRLLGTDAQAIDKAEDRDLFKKTMTEIGQPTIPSGIATDISVAINIADDIGYPVIVRPAFTLGGYGGGVAHDKAQFVDIAKNGLTQSPINQILVEKYIYGWKEIEFEVMRDANDNCIAVCSMENVDPVGVHTGDSIVVAPALTLADKEYQMLRSASLSIISSLGIEGGCNCQFALNPDSDEYAVIEVNPRVSRSSALASKATGYPIAKVSTKIALGYTLDEILNEITGKTYACFEPSLDYVVVKLPKWPFDKFVSAKRTLGTQMKATGEVMSIATSFEMALQKAVQGAEISLDTLSLDKYQGKDIVEELKKVDDLRLFTVFEALKQGISFDTIFDITKIDRFFLAKLNNLVNYEKELINADAISSELYLKGKKYGYTDKAIERISGKTIPEHIFAVYKMVDTCAGEFLAETPYFYASYDEEDEAKDFLSDKKTVVVLGSGPIRIGQGIEFDYSSVHCAWALKNLGYDVVIINNNPETVSTDFDVADRLYFEPLTPEAVLDIIHLEKPVGVVVAFGGQTAIKLTKALDKEGILVLGTSADSIDMAEDRDRFDKLLESSGFTRPEGYSVMDKEQAIEAANKLGYPVLVRPSYVIGGQNMTIAYDDNDVLIYMDLILSQHITNPVLIDKYLMGKELEVDVISDGKDVLIPGIMEHIERAGVHSGDSIAVYPPCNLTDIMKEKIIECSEKLALALSTRGLVNIQYVIYQNALYVIEVNPRASRTIPYISKVTGIPMVDIATRIMMGESLKDIGCGTGLAKNPPYKAVKVPVFSFEKLNDANSILGPEMKSTGEVLGLGKSLEEALFKGLISAGFRLDYNYGQEQGLYISVHNKDKPEATKLAKKFYDLGLKIYATPGTAKAIEQLGNDIIVVNNPEDDDNIYPFLEAGKINYIVTTCPNVREYVDEHIKLKHKSIQLNIACMTSLDTANALADILKSRYNEGNTELIDLNNMRKAKLKIPFSKMQTAGNDYIYINNWNGDKISPESLTVSFCDRNFGIGGDGIVLIEKSDIADAKMRIFNKDGSEGKMAGNCLRCVAKYIYDSGLVNKTDITIETFSGVKDMHLFISDNEVSSVMVNMGAPNFAPESIPIASDKEMINQPLAINDEEYLITCLSMGNPHCVVFCPRVDDVDIEKVGPAFEYSPFFPERVNVGFARVVDRTTIKLRVWERGNGETLACGTGAAAAVVAAVKNGWCDMDTDINVKVRGGDLYVKYTKDGVFLTGNAELIFEGVASI